MLFRCFAVILIAASVLVSGSRAPQGRPAKASGAAPVTRQLDSSDAQNTDAALAPSHEDASTNVDLKNLIDAHAHFAAGVIHEMNLEAESALDDYYNAALLDPTNEELVLDVAQQFLQAKRPEKALDLLSRASTNPAASGALFAEMGFVYSKLGRTNEAVAADRAAIRKDPRSIAGYQSLFLDFSQNKQTSEIWTLLDEASRVRGADAEFLIGLAELYFHMGIDSPQDKSTADARALSLLQRAAKTNPSDLRLQLRLAEGFVRLGKTDDAARFYEVAVKQLPDTAPQYDAVHEELANIYLQNHDTRRAAEQLEIVARDNPTDAQTYYKLGGIAYENTNYVKAMDYFRNAILFSPDFELAYYNLATAQMGADKTADALETLGRARRRFSQNFMGEYLSGMACSQEKDFTNALQHFTTAEILAKNTDPSRLTDTFYFQLGAACERTGDYARAETYFSNCLKLAPDSAEALNYLGFMWADRGEKLDKARDLISRALKSDPKNAAYLDSMAWVLYKLHQNKPALDYALKAIQFSEEEDATVYDHLGDIYNALGQKDKARQAWNKSLSLEADETVRKKIDSAGK